VESNGKGITVHEKKLGPRRTFQVPKTIQDKFETARSQQIKNARRDRRNRARHKCVIRKNEKALAAVTETEGVLKVKIDPGLAQTISLKPLRRAQMSMTQTQSVQMHHTQCITKQTKQNRNAHDRKASKCT
jgi:hypothetical protein